MDLDSYHFKINLLIFYLKLGLSEKNRVLIVEIVRFIFHFCIYTIIA